MIGDHSCKRFFSTSFFPFSCLVYDTLCWLRSVLIEQLSKVFTFSIRIANRVDGLTIQNRFILMFHHQDGFLIRVMVYDTNMIKSYCKVMDDEAMLLSYFQSILLFESKNGSNHTSLFSITIVFITDK